MFELHQLILWLSVMTPLIFSPGPANISVAGSAAKGGLRSTLPFIAGISCVNLLLLVSIGLTFSQLQHGAPTLFKAIELLGAAYICYLAFCFLAPPKPSQKQTSNVSKLNFYSGITLQLLNGKFYPTTIMMFSLFLDQSANIRLQVLTISLMLTLLAIVSYLLWGTLGTVVQKSLSSNRAEFVQRYVFGGLLLITGIWFMIENITMTFK